MTKTYLVEFRDEDAARVDAGGLVNLPPGSLQPLPGGLREVQPGPGRTFVLEMPDGHEELGQGQIGCIVAQLEERLPGSKALVLPPGWKLRTASPYYVRERMADYEREVGFATPEEQAAYLRGIESRVEDPKRCVTAGPDGGTLLPMKVSKGLREWLAREQVAPGATRPEPTGGYFLAGPTAVEDMKALLAAMGDAPCECGHTLCEHGGVGTSFGGVCLGFGCPCRVFRARPATPAAPPQHPADAGRPQVFSCRLHGGPLDGQARGVFASCVAINAPFVHADGTPDVAHYQPYLEADGSHAGTFVGTLSGREWTAAPQELSGREWTAAPQEPAAAPLPPAPDVERLKPLPVGDSSTLDLDPPEAKPLPMMRGEEPAPEPSPKVNFREWL